MYETNDSSHDFEAALAAGVALQANEALGDAAVLVPPGYKVEDLERYHDAPRRHRAKVTVDTVDSFERYLARFHGAPLAVFADPKGGTFRAVLDYHTAPVPGWGEHTCTLQLTMTPEWVAWMKKDGVRMGQVDFAEFIETNIKDVATPAGAELLQHVSDMQALREVQFASKVNLDRGDLTFTFKSETKGNGQVHLPERFTLGLAPFLGMSPFAVEARLRYRVDDEGGLTLWYQLLDADRVLDAAAEEALQKVREVAGDERVFVGRLG